MGEKIRSPWWHSFLSLFHFLVSLVSKDHSATVLANLQVVQLTTSKLFPTYQHLFSWKKIGLQLALKCQNSKLRVRTKTCSQQLIQGFKHQVAKPPHPFHLHRRILLVQQHERCSLRLWGTHCSAALGVSQLSDSRLGKIPRLPTFDFTAIFFHRLAKRPVFFGRLLLGPQHSAAFFRWHGTIQRAFCLSLQWPKLLTERSPSKWKCKCHASQIFYQLKFE